MVRARAHVKTAPSEHVLREEPELRAEESALLRWLLGRAGIDASHYRRETLARRFHACLRALRCTSPAQARVAIERNPQLLDVALNALLIGVTGFFRDERAFASLRGVALPQLLPPPQSLRIWSVACSNGAELYSVAILLAERGTLHRCELLGTDCRPAAIREASAGRFAEDLICDTVPEVLASRYLRPGLLGAERHVCAELRKRVRWRVSDVLEQTEPGTWDLILCRNLAIYLNGATVARLWDALYERLRPGGFLMVGKSERPTTSHGQLTNVAPCLYQRET